MAKKSKLSVWNKKRAKIASSKILKTQKQIKGQKEDEEKKSNPMRDFVKKLDSQIRNAAKE